MAERPSTGSSFPPQRRELTAGLPHSGVPSPPPRERARVRGAAGAALPRILATLVFIALIATPLALRHFSSPSRAEASSTGAALERYGFALREVSHAAGIRFTHQAPALDPKLDAIMPAVSAFGAAVSIVDYDRDGWQDLYVTNSAIDSHNALYRNEGDGMFEDVDRKSVV